MLHEVDNSEQSLPAKKKKGIPCYGKRARMMSCCWGLGLVLMAHTFNQMQTADMTHRLSHRVHPLKSEEPLLPQVKVH